MFSNCLLQNTFFTVYMCCVCCNIDFCLVLCLWWFSFKWKWTCECHRNWSFWIVWWWRVFFGIVYIHSLGWYILFLLYLSLWVKQENVIILLNDRYSVNSNIIYIVLVYLHFLLFTYDLNVLLSFCSIICIYKALFITKAFVLVFFLLFIYFFF